MGEWPAEKLVWINGYLLMHSRSGDGLLIEFDDMEAPCWVPASMCDARLYELGQFGEGEFGLPEFIAVSRITVVAQREADRHRAADRADAERRKREEAARRAAQEKARKTGNPDQHAAVPLLQFSFDLEPSLRR